MPPRSRRQSNHRLFAILALALYGIVSVSLATRNGVGVSPDSIAYLTAAGHARDGEPMTVMSWEGVPVALTHYPPLYPLVVGLLARTGIDMLTVVRGLDVLCFPALIVMAACVINRGWRPFTASAVLGAAVIASSLDLLAVHVMAWSEPLFLGLGLGGLCLIGGHITRPRRWTLLGAAGAVALASLVRLPGVALIMAGAASLAWGPGLRGATERWRDALVFGALAAAPLALRMAWNAHATGRPADRQLVVHVLAGWRLRTGILTISSWMLPGASNWLGHPALAVLGGGMFLLVLVAIVSVVRHASRDGMGTHDLTTTTIGGWFMACYLGVLGLDMVLLDASQWPGDRIMTPLLVAIVVVAFDRLGQLETVSGAAGATTRRVVVAASLALVAMGATAQGRFVAAAHAEGLSYSGLAWRDSPTLGSVRRTPIDMRLYSNRPDVIRWLTGRNAVGVPFRQGYFTHLPNRTYHADLVAIGRAVRAHAAEVVWFTPDVGSEEFLPSTDEIESGLGLTALERHADGTIYGAPVRSMR
jgi:hypothetical protein